MTNQSETLTHTAVFISSMGRIMHRRIHGHACEGCGHDETAICEGCGQEMCEDCWIEPEHMCETEYTEAR